MASRSRAQLDAELAQLEQWIPTMLAETDEASRMDAFAARAELIEESAAGIDREYVWKRLQSRLRSAGLGHDDNERHND